MDIAKTAGTTPSPILTEAKRATIIPKSARLGMVIKILEPYMTKRAILGREDIHIPRGRLMQIAMGTLIPTMRRC